MNFSEIQKKFKALNLAVLLLVMATGCTQNGFSPKDVESSNPGQSETDPSTTVDPNTANEEGGVGNTGGGNSDSRERKIIIDRFKNNSADIKADLIQWLREFRQYESQGLMSDQIHKLIDGGLIEDIQKSKYVLSKICIDETGAIKGMSTLKVNNFKNPPQHPDICINVTKLAAEKTSLNDIIGNLVHEHGRHFGIEDVIELDMQPMSLYVSEIFLKNYFSRNIMSDPVVGVTGKVAFQAKNLFISKFFGYMAYIYPRSKTTIEIKQVEGDCSQFRVSSDKAMYKADGTLITTREKIGYFDRIAADINVGPLIVNPDMSSAPPVFYIQGFNFYFGNDFTCKVKIEFKTATINSANDIVKFETEKFGAYKDSSGIHQIETWLGFYLLNLKGSN